MAAASTRSIRLHTNLLIVAYRNPFLVAKGVALPGESRDEQLEAIDAFGTSVLARLGTR